MTYDVPRSILAPVDFGEASARAVALAGFIAQTCEARLRLLHAEAAEAPAYFTSEQLEALGRERQKTRAQAEQYLARFGHEHTAALFSPLIDDRSPVEAILLESKTSDLIVMGTHGRHGPSRWWLGSVAERVLRTTGTPLLIVRAGMRQPVESLFTHVLVHAAAPVVGEHTLAYANALAARFHGAVTDARYELVEPALGRIHATLLVAATPHPTDGSWLTNYGEPLVRFCTVPILFVPDQPEASSS
jgi:nucleotide-binding universal stress UspA family protein